MQKCSGLKTEIIGSINPLNLIAGVPASLIAALTKTKGHKAMLKQQKKTLSNLLIPGAAPYRSWKRYGNVNKQIRDYDKKMELLKKLTKDGKGVALAAGAGAAGAGAGVLGASKLLKKKGDSEKTAGAASEVIGSTIGGSFGGLPGIIGLLRKPATLKHLSKADKKILSNILMPGAAQYRMARKLKFSHDQLQKALGKVKK